MKLAAFVTVLTVAVGGVHAAAPVSVETANARITGRVLVCNAPGRCLTRVFRVVAVDRAGRVVAHAATSGTANVYRLSVAAGRYSLVATSHGLRCRGSVVAVAHRTVSANITCLVP
jgi:hypothetical protein